MATAGDNLLRNAPEPTRTEAEKTFNLRIIEGSGNYSSR
jgi:hypothetical protein